MASPGGFFDASRPIPESPEGAPTTPGSASSFYGSNGRPSAAANLRLALDQRRQWFASANATVASPPSRPEEQPVPLREVVQRCLEEWGVQSTDSDEADDDFCGWRVGSRVEAPAARPRPRQQSASEKSRSGAPSSAPRVGGSGSGMSISEALNVGRKPSSSSIGQSERRGSGSFSRGAPPAAADAANGSSSTRPPGGDSSRCRMQ